MKDKNIGRFISILMKENKLSRNDLSTKLKVSTRTIKKFEKGIIKSDALTIETLCKELKISSYELINGQKGKTREDQNNAVLTILKYDEREKRKFKYLCIVFITLLLLFIPLFFWLQENKNLAYELSAETNNFKYENAMFLRDNGLYYIIFGCFEIKNPEISEENITRVALMSDDRLIIESNTFINGVNTERKGYDELFPKEVVKNIDNWYYEITYIIDSESFTDIIKIKNEDLT